MKSFIFFVSLVLASHNLYAANSFIGSWKANTGKISMSVLGNPQGTTTCSDLSLKFTEDEKGFNLEAAHFFCGASMEIDFSMPEIKIQGGQLVWEKENIGTITENELKISVTRMKDDGTLQESLGLNLVKKAEGVELNYTWMDGATLLEISGTLNSEPETLLSIKETRPREVFCQFWNSETHQPTGNTLFSKFQPGELSVKKCSSQDLAEGGALGFCMEFTRASESEEEPNGFSVILYRTDKVGVTKINSRYDRHLPDQKIENINLTADNGNGYYTSALCSPQHQD